MDGRLGVLVRVVHSILILILMNDFGCELLKCAMRAPRILSHVMEMSRKVVKPQRGEGRSGG